ncbi:uncharacterized protein A4U43_C01F14370 [Asparagus officinalis]|uniref:Uncharacterized protein n=1 Tax=Asparagus officinalis TaxID=4686 RepID=A0A5P1FQ46_ASPOF|nr:uncharacterized protein A4U43_C01F14370 [Asparagus officinalis]
MVEAVFLKAEGWWTNGQVRILATSREVDGANSSRGRRSSRLVGVGGVMRGSRATVLARLFERSGAFGGAPRWQGIEPWAVKGGLGLCGAEAGPRIDASELRQVGGGVDVWRSCRRMGSLVSLVSAG